jgi:hypothetical protein
MSKYSIRPLAPPARVRRALLLIVGLCAVLCPAAAQERPFMDPGGNLIQYDERPIGMTRIRVACAADSAKDVPHLRDEEFTLAAAAAAHPDDRQLWHRLGCTRALLFTARALASPGFLMPLGTSWAGGAVAVLLRAVDRWPDDRHLSHLVATLSLETLSASKPGVNRESRRTRTDDQPPAPAHRRLWAVLHSRDGTPIEYRACVSLALELSKSDDATWCARQALALGVDSTWHLLRLSYLAFRDDRLLAGKLNFDLAVTSAHTPAMRAEVGWHLVHHSMGFSDNLKYAQPWQMMSRAVNDSILTLPDSVFPGWVVGRNHALRRHGWPSATVRLFMSFHDVVHSGGGFRGCLAVYGGNLSCPTLPSEDWRRWIGVLEAESYRVWSDSGQSVVALMPVRITPPSCSGSRPEHPTTHVMFRRWDARTRLWSSRAVDAPFRRSPSDDHDGCARDALFTFAGRAAPGTWAISVIADSGRWTADNEGVLPPLADAPLALSDLVIGRPGRDPDLRLNGETTAASPTDRFESRDTLNVFFQVQTQQSDDSASVALEILKLNSRNLPGESRIRLTFPTRLNGRFTPVLRLLSLGPLDNGHYLLRVTVSTDTRSGSAERRLTIE